MASGERKLVALLFADLSGFTALASSLDPEEVYAFIRPGLDDMLRIVEEYGGSVPHVMGDGFMAVFGVPTAHKDDPERAVRAALAVRDHARTLQRRAGIRFPDVHAGVNSGEVMVAPSSEPGGFTVLGDPVNVAARLADLAPPRVVLVAEQTKRRTEHAVRYGPGRGYRAKGKPAPVVAFEAIEVRSALPAGRATPAVSGGFVNRETELDALERALAATLHERRSNLLVVTAEPGAGKTRLATEFARRRPDAILLTGRCMPYGQRLPLSPIAGAVQDLIGLAADAPRAVADLEVRRLADRVAGPRRARDLVRGLKLLLGTADPHRVRDPSGAVGEATLAARAVVEGLAREGPVIAVVDDLHWADAQLLELLHGTTADPWSGPVLLLGLSRPDALEARPDALPTLELGALAERELRELGELALGPGAPAKVLDRVAARASGNPLFLEEILSMLVESGALVQRAGRWVVADPGLVERVPATIRTLIAARLDGLPSGEKRVLQDAAVCGEAAWDRLLEAMSGADDIQPALKRLVHRGLLRQRPYSPVPGAEEYGFKHVLIREVAYDSIPRRDRSDLHLRVATWLQAAALAEEPVAELAHHYEQAWRLSRSGAAEAGDQHLAGLAARYLGRLADRTLTYQARLAESLYGRAVEAAEASTGEEPGLVIGLSLGRAECLIELGRHEEAAAPGNAARDLAREAGDEHLEARALLALGVSSPTSVTRRWRGACSPRPCRRSRRSGTRAGRDGPSTGSPRSGAGPTTPPRSATSARPTSCSTRPVTAGAGRSPPRTWPTC